MPALLSRLCPSFVVWLSADDVLGMSTDKDQCQDPNRPWCIDTEEAYILINKHSNFYQLESK